MFIPLNRKAQQRLAEFAEVLGVSEPAAAAMLLNAALRVYATQRAAQSPPQPAPEQEQEQKQ